MFRVKPSKPVALLSALVGVGMIGFAWAAFSSGGSPPLFVYFWILMVVGIVGVNLWAAFSPKGSEEDIVQSGPLDVHEESDSPDDSPRP